MQTVRMGANCRKKHVPVKKIAQMINIVTKMFVKVIKFIFKSFNIIEIIHAILVRLPVSNRLLLIIILSFSGLCLVDEECEFNEKCYNGRCINPCKMEKACGINALCRTDNHVLQCSCPQSFTGNQDMECVRSKFFYLFLIN